jgi:ribonucleoside-diphosphate reductase beta chain
MDSTSVDEVGAALAVADTLVGPIELVDRWERQMWTTRELRIERDRKDWRLIGPFTRRELQFRLHQFFLGEAAVTRTLPALTLAAPSPAAQMFLATQCADEARHTLFFMRYLQAVGEIDDEEGVDALAGRWSIEPSAGHTRFFDLELEHATEAVRADPSDRGAWLAGVTIYHLLTEAVLAIAGQRAIIRVARRSERLPALIDGAINVARDESRHIGFGVRALRDGVQDGHGDVIASMVRRQIPLVVSILVNPERRMPALAGASALGAIAADMRADWRAAWDALAKRLRLIGLGDELAVAADIWQSAVESALADYRQRHGAAHPAARTGAGESPAGARARTALLASAVGEPA